ncbi:snare associated Golgi protein-domain-containing protein [Xylariales sp. AK1849]|nr:snare associated Golgi protein-domain-containing protein [Xylariales sp. AK1849]
MKDVEMAKKTEPSSPYASLEDTDYRPVNWKKIFLTPKYIPWHILWIAIAILTVIITIKHDQVVDVLRPFSEKVRDIPAGWLIPIAILIVISFPPLFGHEVIGLLCGVVYGLWIGFAIVAAGTFLGEVGTWFAFKKALRSRAIKLERTNLNYGALARLTREGGFWIVFIIRFSVVPSHFSTAVFSTCDVKFWYFAVATFLTLPKQIFIVYLGVLLVAQNQDNTVETVVLCITFAITVVMGVYIWFKMKKIKATLLAEQAARRNNVNLTRPGDVDSASSSSNLTTQVTREEGQGPTPWQSSTGVAESRLSWERPIDMGQRFTTERNSPWKTTPEERGQQPTSWV